MDTTNHYCLHLEESNLIKHLAKNGVYNIRIHGNILKNYLLKTLKKYLYLHNEKEQTPTEKLN